MENAAGNSKLTIWQGLQIMAALGLYAFGIIWWVADTNATDRAEFKAETVRFENDERRLQIVENDIQLMNAAQNQIDQRLTRVEEDIKAELETSRRIEIMVQGMARRSK